MAPSPGSSDGPLTGLRVLDLSRVLAGPYCAMLLGDAGADVIKVESPAGDDTRTWGPPFLAGCEPRPGHPGDSAYYLSCNRNKRGVVLDLTSPGGQEAVRRLAARADVLIENFKPGTMEKWGLAYEEVLQPLNPGLVYANISGYGRTGPDADLPGYDFVAQAVGGIMSITGEPGGNPMKVGVAATDLTTGMLAAFSICAALLGRQRTQRGQRVELSLLETQVAWLANVGQSYLLSNTEPARYGNAHPTIVPYELFHAADKPIVVAVGNDGQFRKLCEILGAPEWADDERFATNAARLRHREPLVALIAGRLREAPAHVWLEQMVVRGVPGGPVRSLPEVFADPQVLARSMKLECCHPVAGALSLIGIPFKFGETPATLRRHPPRWGEHTAEVLGEAGYSEAEIERLLARGGARD